MKKFIFFVIVFILTITIVAYGNSAIEALSPETPASPEPEVTFIKIGEVKYSTNLTKLNLRQLLQFKKRCPTRDYLSSMIPKI